MKRFLKSNLILLYFLSLPIFTSAQSTWHKLTDFAPANSLSNLSQGQNQTIYGRSIDGWIYFLPQNEAKWTPISNVPNGSDIQKVAADPNSNKLYATTSTWGLLHSSNQGQTWSIQNFGNANPNTGMVPKISYLKALDTKLFVTFPLYQSNGRIHSKIYYSSNAASSYQLIGNLPTYVYDVKFLQSAQNELWLATQNGLYHTSNILNSNINLTAFENQEVVSVETNGNSVFVAIFDGTFSQI